MKRMQYIYYDERLNEGVPFTRKDLFSFLWRAALILAGTGVFIAFFEQYIRGVYTSF